MQHGSSVTSTMADKPQPKRMTQLLHSMLSDNSVYSALVPWVLSNQSTELSEWANLRPNVLECTLHYKQVQSAQFRSFVVAYIRQECQAAVAKAEELRLHSHKSSNVPLDSHPVACSLCSPSMQAAGQVDDIIKPTKRSTPQSGAESNHPNQLPSHVRRLAKLHGHLLAHGLSHSMLSDLSLLISMIYAAPATALHSDSAKGQSNPDKTLAHVGARPCNVSIACWSTPITSQPRIRQSAHSPQLANSLPSPSAALSTVPCTPAPSTSSCGTWNVDQPVLCCGLTAVKYACKVLEGSGRLPFSLSQQLTQELAKSSALQRYAPQLAQALARAAQQEQQQQQKRHNAVKPQQWQRQQLADCANTHTPVSFATVSLNPGCLNDQGTPANTCRTSPAVSTVGLLKQSVDIHVRSSRSSQDTRRVNNREKCRDMFFSTLRNASRGLSELQRLGQQHEPQPQPHQQQQQPLSASNNSSHSRFLPDASLAPDQQLLCVVREAMQQLLQQCQEGNLQYLAELFTACMLQAVTTGEPVIDSQLAQLAQKDPARFQKLHQRLHDSGTQRPAGQDKVTPEAPTAVGVVKAGRWSGNIRSSNGYATQVQPQLGSVGLVAGASQAAQQAGASRTGPVVQQAPAGFGSTLPYVNATEPSQQFLSQAKPQTGSDSSTGYQSLQTVHEFPDAQHVFVLLLEAADSSKLNAQLLSCMIARSMQMLSSAGQLSTASGIGHQCSSMCTLAMYISYLCFRHQQTAGIEAADPGIFRSQFGAFAPALQLLPQIDVSALVTNSTAHAAALALVLPWLSHYLWFLPRQPGQMHSPYFAAFARSLHDLQSLPALQPMHPQFGPLGFCLRTCLQSLCSTLGADTLQDAADEMVKQEAMLSPCINTASPSVESDNKPHKQHQKMNAAHDVDQVQRRLLASPGSEVKQKPAQQSSPGTAPQLQTPVRFKSPLSGQRQGCYNEQSIPSSASAGTIQADVMQQKVRLNCINPC